MKINEAQLAKIISKAINEALSESGYDNQGSGIEDYQGTGSAESKERVKKIRDFQKKYNGSRSMHSLPGHGIKNGSTYSRGRKLFGGENSKAGYEKFLDFIKPLSDQIANVGDNYEAYERLDDLRRRFFRDYQEWAQQYKGASEEE